MVKTLRPKYNSFEKRKTHFGIKLLNFKCNPVLLNNSYLPITWNFLFSLPKYI